MMKKQITSAIFTLALILSVNLGWSQLTEAAITYEIEMDSDDPMVQQQLPMMEGSTMTTYFKGDNFRQEMDMKMMKTTTVHSGKTGEGIVLMDMMGMKQAIDLKEFTEAATGKSEDDSDADSAQIEITDETKEIAGYKCHKVIVTDADGNELIMYVTKEIKPANNQGKYASGNKVDGFPLQIESVNDQMTMTMTATKVEKKVDKKKFDTKVPEGYQKLEGDAVKQMLQMMGK